MASLALSDDLLQNLFLQHISRSPLNDVLMAVSEEGNVLHVHSFGQELLGYALNDLVGKPFASFVHPGNVECVAALFHKAQASGLHHTDVIQLFASNGSPFSFRFSVSWHETEKLFFCVGTDVSQLKNAN
jgi:PAS domain S-box-containing protein